ncbi:Glycosyltransferase family 17 [Rubripirellula tenax]|uniref:Glycosyltransferase family 17 n=1 Tax=Rubripirellula tenax TaxID=2528015 RepID=A0A5C6EET7_9BACT|nr:hypothetical protein [Rubripirellula tenax]TWU47532.1 Glycosyltransferase family 17 [Rubripirellula tenax]
MKKLIDCFLYNDEVEILEIRIRLLSDVVDRFVVVVAEETFTGRKKAIAFPEDNPVVVSVRDRIDLVTIPKLVGKTAYQKENYSRNQIAKGLTRLSQTDLILVSDLDEIPRPSILEKLKSGPDFQGVKTLELDYFNFKLNYKMFHGTEVLWPGPTVCLLRNLSTPQAMRNVRWTAAQVPATRITDAGWHFSFITAHADLTEKLADYIHREKEVLSRTEKVAELIRKREGFFDHLQPGNVWGFVALSDFRCEALEGLILEYPDLWDAGVVDDASMIEVKIKRAMLRVCENERSKILRRCQLGELRSELARRVWGRLSLLRRAVGR